MISRRAKQNDIPYWFISLLGWTTYRSQHHRLHI